jgi:hypothetical protein
LEGERFSVNGTGLTLTRNTECSSKTARSENRVTEACWCEGVEVDYENSYLILFLR